MSSQALTSLLEKVSTLFIISNIQIRLVEYSLILLSKLSYFKISKLAYIY